MEPCWLKGWKTKKVLAGAAGDEGAAGAGEAGAAGVGEAILTGWDCLGASVRLIRTGVVLWVGGGVGL